MEKNTVSISHGFSPPDAQDPAGYYPGSTAKLHTIAARLFRSERPDHILEPTTLVHEAAIRFLEHGPKKYADRAHFFGVASRAMRQRLVEYVWPSQQEARRRLAPSAH